LSLSGLSKSVLALGHAGALPAAAPAGAQEITEQHLQAALDALKSARASRGFDALLPAIADRVKNQLIRIRPDLHQEISKVVEETALKLAARRSDLDNDMARGWAKSFSIEELGVIATFYRSEAGQKFAELGPAVIAETLQVAGNGSDRVGAELLEKAREELKKQGVEF